MRKPARAVLGLLFALGTALALGGPKKVTAHEPNRHDRQWCWNVRAEITASFTSDACDSVVGLCTVGSVRGGFLHGETQFSATGVGGGAIGEDSIVTPPAEPSSTWSYSGTLVLQTLLGSLTFSDVGVFDTAGGGFSEIDRVVDGSGLFAGATGKLFIYGDAFPDRSGFDGDIRGRLCVPLEAPHRR